MNGALSVCVLFAFQAVKGGYGEDEAGGGGSAGVGAEKAAGG